MFGRYRVTYNVEEMGEGVRDAKLPQGCGEGIQNAKAVIGFRSVNFGGGWTQPLQHHRSNVYRQHRRGGRVQNFACPSLGVIRFPIPMIVNNIS